MPEEEKVLIAAVVRAREAYRAGANDMAKGAARPARAQEICAALRSPIATDWVGAVERLSSNNDGKGVLAVSLAKI